VVTLADLLAALTARLDARQAQASA
jgi:hypothetical protein